MDVEGYANPKLRKLQSENDMKMMELKTALAKIFGVTFQAKTNLEPARLSHVANPDTIDTTVEQPAMPDLMAESPTEEVNMEDILNAAENRRQERGETERSLEATLTSLEEQFNVNNQRANELLERLTRIENELGSRMEVDDTTEEMRAERTNMINMYQQTNTQMNQLRQQMEVLIRNLEQQRNRANTFAPAPTLVEQAMQTEAETRADFGGQTEGMAQTSSGTQMEGTTTTETGTDPDGPTRYIFTRSTQTPGSRTAEASTQIPVARRGPRAPLTIRTTNLPPPDPTRLRPISVLGRRQREDEAGGRSTRARRGGRARPPPPINTRGLSYDEASRPRPPGTITGPNVMTRANQFPGDTWLASRVQPERSARRRRRNDEDDDDEVAGRSRRIRRSIR
jgi:hypothetical protein